MNDYNSMHALYHSNLAKQELDRRKRNYEVINQDFLQDLPGPIREVMDRLRWDYGNRPWFSEAWEKYRKSVLDAGLGGKIKMPGSVFNEYFDKYELKELEKTYGDKGRYYPVESAYHSDMYMEDYLMHYGVKGQKWGIRRFQNEDGTLTAEGKLRYGVDENGNMSEKGKELYEKDTRKTALENAKQDIKKANLKTSPFLSESINKQRQRVAEIMVRKKYGDQTLNDFVKDSAKREAIQAGAVTLAALGLVVGSGVLAIRNAKKV